MSVESIVEHLKDSGIGNVDEPPRAKAAWTRKFNEFQSFIHQNRKLPSRLGNAAEKSLYLWTSRQFRRSILTPTQRAALSAALSQVEPPIAWTRKFNELQSFIDQNGKQPSQLGNAAEKSLYLWKSRQFRRSSLPSSQRAALSRLEPPKRSETHFATSAPKRSALALLKPSRTHVWRKKLNKRAIDKKLSEESNDESGETTSYHGESKQHDDSKAIDSAAQASHADLNSGAEVIQVARSATTEIRSCLK